MARKRSKRSSKKRSRSPRGSRENFTLNPLRTQSTYQNRGFLDRALDARKWTPTRTINSKIRRKVHKAIDQGATNSGIKNLINTDSKFNILKNSVCFKRKIKRQVLFATHNLGSGGVRPKNIWSDIIKCKRK